MAKWKNKFMWILGLFFGITFAYFTWLMWQWLTKLIGDSTWTLIICGVIVLIGFTLGFLSTSKIMKKFT